MGPGILLVPVSVVLCLITSGLLLWHTRPAEAGRAFWIGAAFSAFFASFMLFSHVCARIYVHNLKQIEREPVPWSFFPERMFGHLDSEYLPESLLFSGFFLWGGFLMIKASVAGSPLTFLQSIGVILACALVFSLIGAGIGYALGTFLPGYYRDAVHYGHSQQFDPVAQGLGSGIVQGFIGGVFVGLLLVAVRAWYEIRKMALHGRHDG